MDLFAAEGFHYTGSSSWLSAAVRSSVATSTDLIPALSGDFILKSNRDFSIAAVSFLGHSGDSAFRSLAAVCNRHGFHLSIDDATTGFLHVPICKCFCPPPPPCAVVPCPAAPLVPDCICNCMRAPPPLPAPALSPSSGVKKREACLLHHS